MDREEKKILIIVFVVIGALVLGELALKTFFRATGQWQWLI